MRLPGVRAVFAHLTGSCNLSCGYCYQQGVTLPAMSQQTRSACVEALSTSDEEQLKLTFTGGEPLLEQEAMLETMDLALAHPRLRDRIALSLVTNGLLLRPDLLTEICARGVSISMSLHLPEKPIDAESVRQLVASALRPLGDGERVSPEARIEISMTFIASQVEMLAEAASALLDGGVRSVGFSPVFTRDPDWTEQTAARLDEQLERLVERALADAERNGRHGLVNLDKPKRARDPSADRSLACGAGAIVAISVDTAGDAWGCPVYAPSVASQPAASGPATRALSLGRIDDPRLPERLADARREAARLPLLRRDRRRYSLVGRCDRCQFWDECWFCPAALVHAPSDDEFLRIPTPQCAFNQALGRARQSLRRRRVTALVRGLADRAAGSATDEP